MYFHNIWYSRYFALEHQDFVHPTIDLENNNIWELLQEEEIAFFLPPIKFPGIYGFYEVQVVTIFTPVFLKYIYHPHPCALHLLK
jgi:hypothetical protein